MHCHLASLAILVASCAASPTLVANNFCSDPVWLTLVDSKGGTTGPSELDSGDVFNENIVGKGKSFGVTRNSAYSSSDTPKLIVGTTISNKTLYWSASNVDGDPFADEGIMISTPDESGNDACGAATTADGYVYSCSAGDFALTIDMCSGMS